MNFLASFLQSLKPRYDDDVIDRLNYYYTCLIILILSITISAKQYVGQPIQCWVPAQFTGAWEQYAENYCFVQNTYWLSLRDPIPGDTREREDREIGYYQWVPFIMAIEALFFYVPCVLWRIMNYQSEINVQSVVKMAADAQNITVESREKAVKTISRHIEDAIDLQRGFEDTTSVWAQMINCGKSRGIYITLLYVLVKILYIVNVVGQFLMLNAFLGYGSGFWGVTILWDLYMGHEWEESGHFPRVTLCDFEVRVIGNIHRYTIQCVLMINMFNEKIFLFLWWWFFVVAVATIVGMIYWVMTFLFEHKREDFIRKYIRASDKQLVGEANRKAIARFVHLGLRPDGVFILRLIANNAGDIIATEIIDELWRLFKERHPSTPPMPKLDGGLKSNYFGGGGFHRRGGSSIKSPPLLELNKAEEGFVESLYPPPPASPRQPTPV